MSIKDFRKISEVCLTLENGQTKALEVKFELCNLCLGRLVLGQTFHHISDTALADQTDPAALSVQFGAWFDW